MRTGPVVGALLVTGLLTSGVSSLLVGAVTPLGQVGGTESRVSVLGLYLFPLAVSVVLGAVLLPRFLREFARVRISGEGAFLVVLAGALVTFAVRYAVVETVLRGSDRFAQPASLSFRTGSLALTWAASLAGIAVSVKLVRRFGRPLYSRDGDGEYAVNRPPVVGIVPALILVLVLVPMAGIVLRHRVDLNLNLGGRAKSQLPVQGLSLQVYAEQIRAAQELVVDASNVIAAGRATSTSILLRSNIGMLRARQASLMSMVAPSEQAAKAQRKFAVGLQAFLRRLPHVAALRTTRAQRHALSKAPGLRTMRTALSELDAELVRLNLTGPPIFEPGEWSRILRKA
jgi:hypothetical protein